MKYALFLWAFMYLAHHSAPCTLYSDLSDFERSAVALGMEHFGLKADEKPDGKIIRSIFIYTEEPFSEKAGFLAFFNKLHVNTKDHVIRRELFIEPGKTYKPAIIQDNELALRRFSRVRSLAVIVPMKALGQSVDLLIVTRDILSLRPSFNFLTNSFSLKDLEFLIALGESNFLGLNKSLGASYELKQGMHIISGRYFDPNLLSSRFEMLFKPSLIFARNNFKIAGFMSEFEIKKPLISMTEKWGYGLESSFGTKPAIDFQAGQVRLYNNAIERRYRWSYGEGRIGFQRSFGSIYKKEIFSSYNLNIKKPSIPSDLYLPKNMRQDFIAEVMPKNEVESFINLGFAYFENRYLTLYNYNNFELQELKTLGPSIRISNDFATQDILMSDHDFLRPSYKISYTQDLGLDSFITLLASGTNRWDGHWSDNTYKLALTAASPQFFKLARIVMDGRISMALNNRDNYKFTLGSDSGLRGVASRLYSGHMGFRSNVEIRSAPLPVWILHAGLVIFYDTGAVFNRWSEAHATQSLGIGLRILAPQLSSELFRFDLGFPIYGNGKRDAVVVPSLGLGQAF